MSLSRWVGLWAVLTLFAVPAGAEDAAEAREGVRRPVTRYRTVKVDGLDVFYREAGPANAPVLLLLHGFPQTRAAWRAVTPPAGRPA